MNESIEMLLNKVIIEDYPEVLKLVAVEGLIHLHESSSVYPIGEVEDDDGNMISLPKRYITAEGPRIIEAYQEITRFLQIIEGENYRKLRDRIITDIEYLAKKINEDLFVKKSLFHVNAFHAHNFHKEYIIKKDKRIALPMIKEDTILNTQAKEHFEQTWTYQLAFYSIQT